MKKYFETFLQCWKQYNKLWHLFVGFAIVALFAPLASVNWGFTGVWACLILAFITGGIKEFLDMATGGEYNWWDLGFTTLGGLLGVCYFYYLVIVV